MAAEAFSQAPPQKQPKYASLFVAATLTGLWTQRHVFHDPSNVVTARFYGGRQDVLWDGLNVELSNELTLIRRFGTTTFSGTTYPTAPDKAFSFELSSGAVQVIIDTATAVYVDNQDGTKTQIFTKSAGAGQGYFVGAADTLYYGDGVDLLKYTPGNPNGTSWLWGIASPAAAPTVTVVASGASAVAWAASTVFSTMGLIVDGNGNTQQLYSVNALANNSTQIGLSGNGAPLFSTGAGTTTNDGSVVWTSQGQIGLWSASTIYQSGQAIYDPATNAIWINSHNYSWTSGTKRPAFTLNISASGTTYSANRVAEYSGGGKWMPLGVVGGTPSVVTQWSKNTVFNQYIQPSTGNDPSKINAAICFPVAPYIAANGTLCNGQAIYLLGATTAGTTANTSYTPWTGITSQAIGSITTDNQLAWLCLGPSAWSASTSFIAWVYGNSTFSAIFDGTNMQVCLTNGSSATIEPGTTATLTAAANASGGNTTYTGTFAPVFLANYNAVIAGFTTSANNGTFKVISCSSTQLVVANPSGVAETHAGTAVFNPWGATYGAQTADGTTSWACVGPPVTWAAATQWYLPAVGFAPPLGSQAFGGASVIGSNFVQFVTSSGKSGSVAPSWATTVGATTTDSGITWTCAAAFSAQSITWTNSHVYAYSFKCREATDDYVTTALLTFVNLNTQGALAPLGNVPGLTTPLGAYQGGGTGAVSTASPAATLSTPNTTGAVNTVAGFGSTDPQVDTIVIWRDGDGGGVDNMFELIEIPAPKPIGGVAQPWQFKDFLPDVASTVSGINFPGLDNFIGAPINHANDPPLAAFRPLCSKLHFQRVFGAVGNTVYFSGGPDVLTGNPNEAFSPDDDFPFESTVTACIHTPAGLICPTTTDFECIYGGPLTSSFYATTMVPGVGLLSYNAWDVIGGEICFLSSDSQFWILNPSLQLARSGFPVGNKLKAFNAANAYVTVHESGTDNAVYIADGSSEWFRLNPHQVGADVSGENVSVWSPRAAIVGGCKMVQSLVTAPGVRKLLVGGTGTNQPILKRDTSVYSDNGSAYSSWFDIGAITLVSPGQRAAIDFVQMDFESVGTQPLVSFVIDDPTPSPSWNLLSQFVFDPPIVYQGNAITPNYWPDRFYISQTMQVALGRRIRLKVDFGSTDTVRNELISFGIFGRKYQEL
jgi:hypothetical protein